MSSFDRNSPFSPNTSRRLPTEEEENPSSSSLLSSVILGSMPQLPVGMSSRSIFGGSSLTVRAMMENADVLPATDEGDLDDIPTAEMVEDEEGETEEEGSEDDDILWLPYADLPNSPYYKDTQRYIKLLEIAASDETAAIFTLNTAYSLVEKLQCNRSALAWAQLKPLLDRCDRHGMYECAQHLADVLLNNPEGLGLVVKTLRVVKNFLNQGSNSMDKLEERLTRFGSTITKFDNALSSRLDEVAKMDEHMTSVSRHAASFLESAEGIALKISKLDLLPAEQSAPSTVCSLPETSSSGPLTAVQQVDASSPGSYTGLYSISLREGRVVSVVPPAGHPELLKLTKLDPKYIAVFVNRCQEEVLNRLASNPALVQAFHMDPSPQRGELLKCLIRGVPRREFQWCPYNPERKVGHRVIIN